MGRGREEVVGEVGLGVEGDETEGFEEEEVLVDEVNGLDGAKVDLRGDGVDLIRLA